MADEMSPGLAAEMEARTDAAAAKGVGGAGDAADGALVTKLRLAKTDCRIALQSVNRAQGELAAIVDGWRSGEVEDARERLRALEAIAAHLEGLVHWARGCEDEVLVRMNGRGKDAGNGPG